MSSASPKDKARSNVRLRDDRNGKGYGGAVRAQAEEGKTTTFQAAETAPSEGWMMTAETAESIERQKFQIVMTKE
jgi:hypothetical protein